MKASVVALGKIGLPLAVQMASRGVKTIGADVSSQVVDLVNRGEPPFPGEAHLEEWLRQAIGSEMLRATTDTAEAVRSTDVTVVVVPLMVDDSGTPDFGAIDSATKDIAPALSPGHLVSYETTLPVGTTRDRFVPLLEEGSGMKAGSGFHVVHSPERVFSGRVFADLRRYPKLVGGVTKECGEAAVAFYERILEFDDRPDLGRPNGVWDLGSVEAAELAKLAETTYRDVNIGLANEFAVFAERVGLNVYDVIDAANSQPFSHIHRPGVAVGGHCIPVYPMFYLAGDPTASIPRAARKANLAMPGHAVDLLAEATGGLTGLSVAVLGAAYRGGVKETAFSGAFSLVEDLTSRDARSVVHDPLYSDQELSDLGFEPYHLGDPIDAAILQADHREYMTMTPADLPGCRVIVDGRNMIDLSAWNGVQVHFIGRGDLHE